MNSTVTVFFFLGALIGGMFYFQPSNSKRLAHLSLCTEKTAKLEGFIQATEFIANNPKAFLATELLTKEARVRLEALKKECQ